jgi:hypothetical protein
MKIAYVVSGFGEKGECLGEFAQAEASALYAKEKDNEIIFIVKNKKLIDIIHNYEFQVFHSENTSTTKQIIKKIKPDVLFLCNSKTVYMYKDSIMKEPPFEPRPFICSMDSNWLFLKDKRNPFQAPTWIDRNYVIMPYEIYQIGLIENGGHYKISKMFKEKSYCPGFIPSSEIIGENIKKSRRKELKVKRNEKLIAIYFGAREDIIATTFFPKFIRIIEELHQSNHEIKVWFEGKINIKKEWMTRTIWAKTGQEFDASMASADLVIQHHGLGNLPKVIHNQIPVICLVPELKKKLPYYNHSEFYEIEPFSKLNLCYNLPYTVSVEKLRRSIMELLYDKEKIHEMKKAQKKYFKSGEENLYKDLIQCYHKLT